MLLGAAALGADKKYELSQAQIDDIVQKFAAKELQFSKAREVYTYRQTARIQELDDNGAITGRWETVSDIVFSPEGKRTEHVVRSPVPSLHNIIADARGYGGHEKRPAVCSDNSGLA